MKFKLRERLAIDLIESIMAHNGIFDKNLYVNPSPDIKTDFSKVKNVEEGYNLIKNNLGKEILILVDSDMDGFTSAAIMYKYLKFLNPFANVKYFIHNHKTHGMTPEFMNHVREFKPNLIIVPDAGTNDFEQRKEIVEKGIDLLIIDHHPEDIVSEHGVLINNKAQNSSFNEHLTGAGLTYLFCNYMDVNYFHTDRVYELIDLCMVGLLGDSADTRDNEVRYLCMSGLDFIKSKVIMAALSETSSIEDASFKKMSYGGIIPLTNGVIRVGEMEEKVKMFKALADIQTDYFSIVTKRKLNKETRKYEMVEMKYNAYQLAIDAAKDCKKRQDAIIKKELKHAEKHIGSDYGIEIYEITEPDCFKLTGLLANKLTNVFNKPVVCVWKLPSGDYSGSLRGYEKSLPSLKQWCLDTGLFKLVQGHENAAGVIIESENLELVREKALNVQYEEFIYEVDEQYNGKIKLNDLYDVTKYSSLFENGLQEPIFAVTDLEVTQSNSKWSKNTMRINIDGVTYIRFRTSLEDYEDLIGRKINLIGKFSINYWNGTAYPQFLIEDYDVCYEGLVENDTPLMDFGIFG